MGFPNCLHYLPAILTFQSFGLLRQYDRDIALTNEPVIVITFPPFDWQTQPQVISCLTDRPFSPENRTSAQRIGHEATENRTIGAFDRTILCNLNRESEN